MYGQSTMIIGQNGSKVREKIQELIKGEGILNLQSPDVLELGEEGKNISINEVREAGEFLAKRPLTSKRKALIIYNAKKVSVDAQNALLKTLEEPNSTSHIILQVENAEEILSTITSRCKRIFIKESFSPDEKLIPLAQKFIESKVGERLAFIEENKAIFADRNDTLKFLDTLNFLIRKDLNKQNSKFASIILKVQNDISSTNLNVRLAMEYLAMS